MAERSDYEAGYDMGVATCKAEIERLTMQRDEARKLASEWSNEAGAEIERLRAIESAARNLIGYQTTGAPEHLEWEEKFEALEAALRGEEKQL